MTARDRWIEDPRCRYCGKTGMAELSTADELSWEVRVDSVPEGFASLSFQKLRETSASRTFPFMFNGTQSVHRQIINFELVETCFLDH